MFNKKKNIIFLKRQIRSLLNEMSATVHPNLKPVYDKKNEKTYSGHDITGGLEKETFNPELQEKVTSSPTWEKHIKFRLDKRKDIHVDVFKYTTTINLPRAIAYVSDMPVLQSNEVFLSKSSLGVRTLFMNSNLFDEFVDQFFKSKTINNFSRNLDDEAKENLIENFNILKDAVNKVNKLKGHCVLLSIGTIHFSLSPTVNDLNTGWMAIHKLFDTLNGEFLEHLRKLFNLNIKNNENLMQIGLNISREIAEYNNKKNKQNSNRYNTLTSHEGSFSPLYEPYNLRFQKKDSTSKTFSKNDPYYNKKQTIDFNKLNLNNPELVETLHLKLQRQNTTKEQDNLFKQAQSFVSTRLQYLNDRGKIKDNYIQTFRENERNNYVNAIYKGLEYLENFPIEKDEHFSNRTVQDFLPEMLTYAMGWVLGIEDDKYIIFEDNIEKKVSATEATLRFFKKDAYDINDKDDKEFVEKRLVPFFTNIVIHLVNAMWKYMEGKVIINFY